MSNVDLMAWYTRPLDGVSTMSLPYSTSLLLEEAYGGYILKWVKDNDTIINQWSIHTPSLYEARATSIEIIQGALREISKYMMSSLPIIMYPDHAQPITGCYPPRQSECNKCQRKECDCTCKGPVYKFSIDAQRGGL